MEIIKKMTLIVTLLSTPFIQTIGRKHAKAEFEVAVGRTILASLAINTLAMCTKDNFLPMKAFVPAAVIMGVGMGTLGYLDDRDLKKNPLCGANKRNSRILQSLVIAAGLTPIVLSDSQSGKMLRDALTPAGEYLLQAGTSLVDAVISSLIRGR
jgi:UDP-N-acetylmuramyl pentapeptide phosphotransferase/UDP-N-acetylglucosamine-1-phosphate transferase